MLATLQTYSLPQILLPSRSGIHREAFFSSVRRSPQDPTLAGGDFADSYRAADASMSFVIGDVSAKSVQGEYLAHRLRQTFRRMCFATLRPSEMLAAMDRCLRRELTGMKGEPPYFTTILVVTHSLGKLVYSAAGVESGMMFHRDGTYEKLFATGAAIGIEEKPQHVEREMPFVHGDMLVAYTDGVTESRSVRDGSMLGDEGLVDIVRRMALRSHVSLCRDIFREVELWNGGLLYDDMSLAVVFPSA